MLCDTELAAHKRAMDKNFNKNQLRPGDSDFVYDKVVDFAVGGQDDEALKDDSWDEDGEKDGEYYDEEDEDAAADAALASAASKKHLDVEDNDYFDDDFDDDFA